MRGFLDPQGEFYEIAEERHHEWALRVHGVDEDTLVEKRGWLRVVVGAWEPIFFLPRLENITSLQWEWLEGVLYRQKEMRFDAAYQLPAFDMEESFEDRSRRSRKARMRLESHTGRESILVKVEDLIDFSLSEFITREIRLRIASAYRGTPLTSGHGGPCEY